MREDRRAVEWPTILLLLVTYGLWAFGTTLVAQWSLVAGILVTAIAVAQFSSLQHEVLHGHPFRSRRLNEALVFPALMIFVPYIRFRDTHLAHHHDPSLTDPYDDPEANYLDPAIWTRLPGPLRRLLNANNTLLGRLVIGPAIGVVWMLAGDLRAARAGDRTVVRAWVLHAVGAAMVLAWLHTTGGMSLISYLAACYVAFALLRIRTFLEHRAHEAARARTVIIEDRGPLALLFLNNNLHVVHHMHPSVPWYRLPAMYRANREHYLRRNEGYLYRSYAEIFRRYFLHAKDPVPHPLWPPKPQRNLASAARETVPAE